MSNDDTRGIETPDRSAESNPTIPRTDGGTLSIRDRLTAIDRVTRTLLVDIHNPSGTAIEDVDAETRAVAADHVRQMRAEASHVGLALLGPTATMHYSPFAEAGDNAIAVGAFATTYDGPAPGAYGREHDRSPSDDADRVIDDDTPADDHDDTPTEGGADDE